MPVALRDHWDFQRAILIICNIMHTYTVYLCLVGWSEIDDFLNHDSSKKKKRSDFDLIDWFNLNHLFKN